MKHKKPLKGMYLWVKYLKYTDPADINAYCYWDCHNCGTRRYGQVIKACDTCGTWPSWEYTLPYPVILFNYITQEIKCRLRNFFLAMADKLC